MSRFIKYITIFILPILIIGICMEVMLRKIPNDYLNKKEYLDKNSNNIEALILGSSHSFYGIKPAYIHLRSFNAAYISQSLDYDSAILKKYGSGWQNLKYIILPIDYFSLFSRLGDGVESWRVKDYAIYYRISENQNFENNSEIFSNRLNINIKRLVNYYYKHDSEISSSKLGWGTNYNSKNKKDLLITGPLSAQRHFSKNDRYFNENVRTLLSIIEFANSYNIKVILFTSPAYSSYVQNLNKNQLSRTINTLTEIADSSKNVTYVNFLTDQSFKAEDFYDGDHLNEIGAKEFSIKIDSLLR